MSRLQEWLKGGDPVASEPPLPDADVQRMRRRVIAAGQQHEPGFTAGRRALLGAATVALAGAAIGVVGWMGESRQEPREDGPANGATIAPPVTRQLIFETPGGTRVIWVFNPEFRE
ncbi:MAG TPA: hypothetical protein VFO58_06885 [Vicinamibacterales bacterium]|nr:hypothetical protein [Vicinamibacterales bacterium]